MSYSRVANHNAMMFDATRNELYARAIRKLVKPDSVVLDLGAGLGVHGLLAAGAGAARVYLVEPQPVAHAASEAAQANGLSNRVVVLHDRIEDVQLPQAVDLIISVFTGNLLFSEDLLPSLFHARDKYLKPNGHLLPDRAELWLAPLWAPRLHAASIGKWSEPVVGLDYSQARRFAANEILWPTREDLCDSSQLADGAVIADIDFQKALSGDCKGEASCLVQRSGDCHGLLGWIRIRLNDEWLSTHVDNEVHWRPALLPLDPPLQLTEGEELRMTLVRPAHSDWTWSAHATAGSRRHSSFLARSESPRDLHRIAPASTPGLNAKGDRALRVLQWLHQGWSNGSIADALAAAESIDREQALRHVQALVSAYGGRG
jgi:SAM-dependent methyltransferase